MLTVPASGVLGNDTDPSDDPMTAMLVRSPASGELDLRPDGSFTYDPLGSRGRAFVYCEDFQDAQKPFPEWNPATRDATSAPSRRFLGRFGNETVTLSLADLPPHARVTVAFNLFAIGSWDGNDGTNGPDQWSVAPQGAAALLGTTFANVGGGRQAYPDSLPGGDHPARAGASEGNTLGHPADAVYAISRTFDHSGPTLALDFSASGLSAIAEESWGLDNVCVSIGDALEAAVELRKDYFFARPESFQSMMAPAVADLDGDDVPEIVFSTFTGGDYGGNGVLRAQSMSGEYRTNVDLAREAAAIVTARSLSDLSYGRGRAFDGDETTSWIGVAPDLNFDIELRGDSTVRRIHMVGDRPFNDALANDFLSGSFRLFAADGTLLYDTGLVDFPAPDREVTLDFADVAGVRKVSFVPAGIDGGIPGFVEYQVFGDGPIAGFELFAITDPAHEVSPGAQVAIGDIDLDGRPEIVAVSEDRARLIAFEHDGAFKWLSDDVRGDVLYGAPSIADLDQDGTPEIVIGATALNNDGTLRWWGGDVGGLGRADGYGYTAYSTVADIDLDGSPEVVAGRSAYRADGALYWNADIIDGYPAVANLDDDPEAEIVVSHSGRVWVLEHDGAIKLGPVLSEAGRGPPTIADLDGDGKAEIGTAGIRYGVFESDGAPKWSQGTNDGSVVTGSSVFDFDGDGTAEVVYADQDHLFIYRGATGEVLQAIESSNATLYELPVVVDVDADGQAEIVTSNNTTFGGKQAGISVVGSRDGSWASTRKIWNQHTYHVTNVNDDASIPRVERPNWLVPGLNDFRRNAHAPDDQERTESFTYKANDGALDSNVATVTLQIQAANGAPDIVSPPNTAVYLGSPYVYVVVATDPDAGDELRYLLVEKPDGMSIDASSGQITWAPSALGSFDVTVRVQDRRGLTDTQSFAVVVSSATPAPSATPTPTPGPTATPAPTAAFTPTPTAAQTPTPSPATGTCREGEACETGLLGRCAEGRTSCPAGPFGAPACTPVASPIAEICGNDVDEDCDGEVDDADLHRGADPRTTSRSPFIEPLATALTFPNGGGALALAKGDFNRDGWLDLAATQRDGAVFELSILLGNGDGTFGAPSEIPLAQAPGGLLARHFDADGKLDLALAVADLRAVLLFRGNGDGTFQAADTLPTTIRNGNVQTDDLDGDGHLDLVTTSGEESLAAVLLGDGDGTFGSATTYAFGASPADHALAQIDGMNGPDIVVASSGSQTIGVRLNDGGGGFGSLMETPAQSRPHPQFGYRDGFVPNGLYAADLDLDGATDVVSAAHTPFGCLPRMLGDGSGGFVGPPVLDPNFDNVYDVPEWACAGNHPIHRALSENIAPDLNGDGRPDVVFAQGGSPGINGGTSANNVLVGLTGADGLLAATPWVASPGPGFPPNAGNPSADGNDTRAAVAGDFDADCVMDLAVTADQGQRSGGLAVLLGSSPGRFEAPVLQQTFHHSGYGCLLCIAPEHAVLGDFDDDGDLDVAVAPGGFHQFTRSHIDLLRSNGDGSFAPAEGAISDISIGTGGRLRSADFDGDEHADLAWILAGAQWLIAVAFGNGDGTFSAPITMGSARLAGGAGLENLIVAGDLNGDELPDLAALVDQGSQQLVEIYLSPGTRSAFTAASEIPIGTESSGGHAADVGLTTAFIDGDQVLDVVAAFDFNQTNRVFVFPGNGDGTFRAGTPVVQNLATPIDDIAASDLDHDGDTDLAFSSRFTACAYVALNDGHGAFASPTCHDVKGGEGSSIEIADLDLDGHADLAVGRVSGPGGLYALPGNGDGTFDDALPLALGQPEVRDLDVGDVNRDGRPDLVISHFGFNRRYLSVLLNRGPRAPGNPPDIISSPVTAGLADEPYAYDVDASDPDPGDVLRFSFARSPAGMQIDSATGLIGWIPTLAQRGVHEVRVRVQDGSGLADAQSFTVTIGPLATPVPTPTATPTATPTPSPVVTPPANLQSIVVEPSDPILLTGETQAFTATGVLADGTSQNLTALVAWSSGTPAVASIAASGVATGLSAGTSAMTASLGAIAGSTMLTVAARVAGDGVPPVAEITAPVASAEVTEPIDVVGSATDANFLEYELAIAPAGETSFTIVERGRTPIANGVLGRFDPTLLINDQYAIRLTVFDRGGNQTSAETVVQVAREQKVGLFTLAFQDLNVAVGGLPITVTRRYDSRDKARGDFGFGWRLDVQSLRLRPNREQGSGWRVDQLGFSFVLSRVGDHKVSLTLPNGRVEEFDLVISPSSSTLVPFSSVTASYVARPGTRGSLALLDNPFLLIVDPQPGDVTLLDDVTLNTFDPKRFRYTSADGQLFDIDRTKGVERLADHNGNALTFGPSGITHSSGRAVAFDRDAEDRITRITDPEGNSQVYAYDANGDLVSHTDASGNTTRFSYNRRHDLLAVLDPLGRRVTRNEYDADGRLVAATDAAGGRIEFGHDLGSRQEVVTNRRGFVSVYGYDEDGNLVSQTDPLGNTTTFTYDDRGNTLSRTDPLGHTSTFTYDASDNLMSETDPIGNTTTFTYDGRGQVLSTTNPLGHTTTFAYDARGNLASATDPLGRSTTIAYDGAGNPLSVTDALGHTAHNEFDAVGNRTRLTDVLGNVTVFDHDGNGNLLSQTDAAGRTTSMTYDAANRIPSIATAGATRQVAYDAASQVTNASDASGRQVGLLYDAVGRPTQITSPGGTSEVSVGYDAEGNPTSQTDALGNTTRFEYDAADRLVRTEYPDGSVEERAYDAAGRLIEVTDPLGHTTAFEYDAAGRPVRTTNPLGGVTRREYDGAGNLVARIDPLGRTTRFEYDAGAARAPGSGSATSRLVRTVFPDGAVERRTYDDGDRLLSLVDPAGNATTFAYDAAGRMTSVTNALGDVTRYEYDAAGQRTASVDANGNRTRFSYDAFGRLAQTTHPLGDTESATHDLAGRLQSTTNGNGETLLYAYDAKGRIQTVTLPGGQQETYTFTPDGLVDSVTDARGATRFEYEPATRWLAKVTEPDGRTVRYEYDVVGNRTLTAHAMAAGTPEEITRYAYDALRRLVQVTHGSGGITAYGYDAAGNRTSISQPNGVVTTYGFDARNRVISVIHEKSGTILEGFDYTLDAVGNRKVERRADGARVEYDYDATTRVLAERHFDSGDVLGDSLTYVYDAVGNLLVRSDALGSTTHTYNANNQLVSANGTTYSYDGAGNLVAETAASGSTRYTYDSRGRLLRFEPAAGAATTYTYDWQGVRQSKDGPGGFVSFLVDRANATGVEQVVRETDAGGTTLRLYTYGADLLSRVDGGNRSYHQSDALGSTRLLTDSTGSATDRYAFAAYGPLLRRSGASSNAYQFAGEQRDEESDLYYLRARYYDPTTGRFLGRDPAAGDDRAPLSLHEYLYAHANPVNLTDPTGRFVGLVEVMVGLAIQSGLRQADASIKIAKAYHKFPTLVGNTGRALALPLSFMAIADVVFNDVKTGAFFCVLCFVDPLRQQLAGAATAAGVPSFDLGDDPEVTALASAVARVLVRAYVIVGYARTGVDLGLRNITFGHGEFPGIGKAPCISSNTLACVYGPHPENISPNLRIYYTPLILVRPPIGMDSWAGTTLHEVTHVAHNTKDHAYTCPLSLLLGAGAPPLAVTNADNYTYFVESFSIVCLSPGNFVR